MNNRIELDADELDALKELSNIGMGRAAAELAEVLERRVLLQVPEVRAVSADELGVMFQQRDSVSITRHLFTGDFLHGEAVVLFERDSYTLLMTTFGYDEVEAAQVASKRELLLDVASSLCAACLSGLAEQLGVEVNLSQPRLLCLEKFTSIDDEVFAGRELAWRQVLLIEIGFRLSGEDFHARLYAFVAETSLGELKQRIASILEGLQ